LCAALSRLRVVLVSRLESRTFRGIGSETIFLKTTPCKVEIRAASSRLGTERAVTENKRISNQTQSIQGKQKSKTENSEVAKSDEPKA